jgi:aspartyl-tRNA(Asn)/glutamyl-tRNA(Gln) amidotransferase subunit A
MDLLKLTIKEASEKLQSKEITVRELVDAYLARAKEINDDHNTYLEFFDDVDAQVEAAQARIDSGNIGESDDKDSAAAPTLLTGIPIALKDNIMIEGKKASAASKILENYTATYTATAARKLIDAGAVILGRLNMDEFAMGGSTENSAFGPTKNAHDTDRVAGGSSGGSAVAVATQAAMATLGSDTGGSIRQPAAFNGVVGLKPTYGSVSRNGLMAMASSLDIIGPITKTVEDAEIIFNIIKGVDPLDSTTVEAGADGGAANDAATKTVTKKEPKKIGVPRGFLKEGVDPDVLANFDAALEKMQADGYEIVDVDLPSFEYALAVYYVLMPAEVSSNMARYDGIKYGASAGNDSETGDLIDGYFKTRGRFLGAEVRRRIMLGTYVLSAGYSDQYYNQASAVRTLMRQELEKVFTEVDVVALPTTPTPAFKIGEKSDDPLQMYLEDIFTVPANLTGVPAISIPSGTVDRDGKSLPLGLQLIAPQLAEQLLFKVGQKFEIME